MKNETLLADFQEHLLAGGKKRVTAACYVAGVRRFLKAVGDQPLNRISEEQVRAFFAGIKNSNTRKDAAVCVSRFLNFSQSRLPVPVNARGVESPRAPAPNKKELALRHKWTVEKLLDQKTTDNELIAKLARKVIDGYLICQREIKGEQNLDDLVRYVDECRELIETNLTLFMGLSAQGHNVHSKIDERVIR